MTRNIIKSTTVKAEIEMELLSVEAEANYKLALEEKEELFYLESRHWDCDPDLWEEAYWEDESNWEVSAEDLKEWQNASCGLC